MSSGILVQGYPSQDVRKISLIRLSLHYSYFYSKYNVDFQLSIVSLLHSDFCMKYSTVFLIFFTVYGFHYDCVWLFHTLQMHIMCIVDLNL